MKNKRIITILLLIVMIVLEFSYIMIPTRADSGWDSSYDSGGSWDSGSSWDSGGSWDSGSSWDYDSSTGTYSGGGGIEIPTPVFIFCFVLACFIAFLSKDRGLRRRLIMRITLTKPKELPSEDEIHSLVGLSGAQVYTVDPSINPDEIVAETFDLYKKIQIAWMDFDYKTLEENLTDELYNNYKMLLEALELKGEKNIMHDITFIEGVIKSINNDDDKQTIVVKLRVKVKDYVINNLSKQKIRGKYSPIKICYNITIVRKLTEEKYCINCGGELDSNNHQTCPYCGATITRKSNKFVMSKKEVVKR